MAKVSDLANPDRNVFKGVSLVDSAFLTGSKIGVDEIFSRQNFIENTTYMSGGTKILGGLLVSLSKNKFVSYLSGGMVMSGMEDVYLNATNQFTSSNNSGSQNEENII